MSETTLKKSGELTLPSYVLLEQLSCTSQSSEVQELPSSQAIEQS